MAFEAGGAVIINNHIAIQRALALPAYPQEQLMIDIAHHSDGPIFDKRGINSFDMASRHEFLVMRRFP